MPNRTMSECDSAASAARVNRILRTIDKCKRQIEDSFAELDALRVRAQELERRAMHARLEERARAGIPEFCTVYSNGAK